MKLKKRHLAPVMTCLEQELPLRATDRQPDTITQLERVVGIVLPLSSFASYWPSSEEIKERLARGKYET